MRGEADRMGSGPGPLACGWSPLDLFCTTEPSCRRRVGYTIWQDVSHLLSISPWSEVQLEELEPNHSAHKLIAADTAKCVPVAGNRLKGRENEWAV
jgi:hypothetical protein